METCFDPLFDCYNKLSMIIPRFLPVNQPKLSLENHRFSHLLYIYFIRQCLNQHTAERNLFHSIINIKLSDALLFDTDFALILHLFSIHIHTVEIDRHL